MLLTALLRALGLVPPAAPPARETDDAAASPSDPEIAGVTHNSDWVRPGDAFVALRGARVDGHTFIPQAVGSGAVVVVGEGLDDDVTCPVPYVTVPHARHALADIAAELAGHPSRELAVLGVTGTDGKTTTSWMTRHLLREAGEATGLLSTVGYELPDGVLRHFPAHFTTPEAPQVQEILREMVDGGAAAVVLEASSHALALDRVRAVDWDVAIWTHLTSEHLDFHGSVEQYFADKKLLVDRARFAILNLDDPWTGQLRGVAPGEWTYSASGNANADWYATDVNEGPRGIGFHLCSPLGETDAVVPMVGAFNVDNALAALAGAAQVMTRRGERAGGDLPQQDPGGVLGTLVAGLAGFRGVPGRMELVPAHDIRVIVDFAHTPPSLEKALATVRTTAQDELWVVLGSAGGPRDPGKRAPLGEVAARLADRVVFTEEDHRDTPLADILNEMERGAREGATAAGRAPNWESIGDRREAIRRAIGAARPGATIVLAGKGPEDTMERDTETIPWNEVAEAQEAIAARGRRH